MIARLWHKLFPPRPPRYDPEHDETLAYFREQKLASEQEIQHITRQRERRPQYGGIADTLRHIRPPWEDIRDRESR